MPSRVKKIDKATLKSTFAKIAVSLLLGLICLYFFSKIFKINNEKSLISSLAERISPPTRVFETLKQKKNIETSQEFSWKQAKENIENIIDRDTGTWAVVISQLSAGEALPILEINQNQVFTAASLMKILVASYTWQKIDIHEITLEQSIQDISLKEHLRRIVNQSNNESWYALNDFFSYNNLQSFSQELGLTMTNVYKNTTAAGDMDKLLKSVYYSKKISREGTDAILTLMQKTETEDRITPALPKNYGLWHKTGTWEGAIHDAAIIKTPQGNYYTLVILSQDSPAPREVIRKIVNEVFTNEGS